jgi:anti-sigma factor RsiW
MATGPEQRLNPEERANLVAYIDGELTDAEARAISTKLTQSATARREVESLKKTWELLDCLPRPAASTQFLERTYTEIRRVESRRGSWLRNAETWLGPAARTVLLLLSAAALVCVGFVLSRWTWSDPVAHLARNLSIAEHLQEYREVGSFELLDELARSAEFGSPPREGAP